MTQVLLRSEIKNENDIVWTRKKAREICQFLKFDNQDQTRVATAVSEIIRNAFQYAKGGWIEFSLTFLNPNYFLSIKVTDKGRGIPHLEDIQNGTYVSPHGMGVGLMGAKKLMDLFSIETSSSGTTINMSKALPYRSTFLNPDEINRLVHSLLQGGSESPIDELQKQNKEIIETIGLLSEKTDELNRLNEELQDTNRGVVALYAELDEKAEFLRIANEAKTSFLSNMTHEFRSPVNSILSIAEIIKSEAIREKAQEREKQIGFVIKAANTLSDLINDLLDIAKIEAGKIKVKPSTFKLSEILGALRGLMKPLNTNEQVSLIIDEISVHEDYSIITDEAKLSQILRNLINNALKYTEKGEVHVTTRLEKGSVLIFDIKDTGVGIPPEYLESIFEEFVQLETPLHKLKKGTGLGLPLSKKLARLLSGEIEVTSRVGSGSTFTLKIPLKIKNTEEESVTFHSPLPAPTNTSVETKPTILIIDDDNAMRYSMAKSLEGMNLLIKEARNVYEGLYITKNFFPDLIILDLVMPEKNGIDFINETMSDPKLREIPIILHTSKQLEIEEQEFLEQSVMKIVYKEPSYQILKNTIIEFLSENRLK